MYLDDVIDLAKNYFTANDAPAAVLKIKSAAPLSLLVDHSVAGFAVYAVTAVSLYAGGTGFNRAYLVIEHPNGEAEVVEVTGAHHVPRLRALADARCSALMALADLQRAEGVPL